MTTTSTGCVWLITGANRGIGLEMAKQLLEQPFNTVIATARNPAKTPELHALAQGSGAQGALHVVCLEVTDRESVVRCADEVVRILGEKKLKGIDYLVNNAGIGSQDAAYSMDIDHLEKILRTNVSAPAHIAQVFLPLVERSTKKTIVNMSSTNGSKTWEGGMARSASYSISKAALNMLVRSAPTVEQARERPDITSVCICPGWLQTDMGGGAATHPVSVGVAGVIKVVTGLTLANSGEFINWKGNRVAW
ncbi:NAD(P)-binding protein [Daedaleopsis nitida]|nr:NAD(P)-binding protein [Daedaleopsis nitida]